MESTLTRSELKNKRVNDLLDSVQNEILKQVIGPFGLAPAMFDDKAGGNVTTAHNFKAGVVATEEDKQSYAEWQEACKPNSDRSDYDRVKDRLREEKIGSKDTVVSDYTGTTLKADRDAHLDHVVAVNAVEKNPEAHLYQSREKRVASASQDANLKVSEGAINQSLGDKDKPEWSNSPRRNDPGKTNAESFGVDKDRMTSHDTEAKKAINRDRLTAQIKKQGEELAKTSGKEAGKNALRQAFGVLLHELVTAVISEMKQLLQSRGDGNLVDRLIMAMKRVAARVMAKLKSAYDAAIGGALQGFISNILTFLINTVIKTSAKIVTAIREGMKSLWEAIKMLANPPAGMNSLEVNRQVTKIFTALVTATFGLLFEETIKAFILSVPLLAPLADLISPAITAILTGIATALLIYGIDKFFDWLSSTGTEFLQAIEAHTQSMADNIQSMAAWIEQQYATSQGYQQISQGYLVISISLDQANEHHQRTIALGSLLQADGKAINVKMETEIIKSTNETQVLLADLGAYKLGEE